MKLKTVLRALDIDALRAIQEFWKLSAPDSEADHEAWVEHLYPRLQNGSHFADVLERLDPTERDLLYFLAIHGGNMEEKELRKRFFGGDREAMQACVASLKAHSLLFMERWTDLEGKPRLHGIPEPFLRLIELPHFWKGYLGGLLRNESVDGLLRVAHDGLGMKVKSNKRDHLVYEIRRELIDPGKLRAYVDSLDEARREVLFLLLQRRGVCVYRDLLETGGGRLPDANRAEAIESLLAHSGLVFQATDKTTKHDNLLRVPRDIYYIIGHHFVQDKRGLQELDAMGRVEEGHQPKAILDNGISLLRDLIVFVGHIERNSVRRLGNGGVGKNNLKKILANLSANKTLKYAQFIAWYCIHRTFLVPEGDHWGVSDGFEHHIGDSRELYVDLFDTWFHTNHWNEEFIDGDCVHTDQEPTGLINIIELRRLVLKNLAQIPFDAWVDGPRFIESLLAQIEISIPHRGGRGRLDKHNRINYLAIESILCESLHWFGLLSLGLHEETHLEELGNRRQFESGNGAAEKSGRLDQHFNFNPRPFLPEPYQFHFQINGLGRSLLKACVHGEDVRDLADAPDTALPFRNDMLTFTVMPNLDVVAPPDLNLQHFYRLRQFTEIRHMDVMSTLGITPESIRAGMEHGLRGEAIINFLESGCPSGLPETVRHLVNECSNRYGEVVVGYAGGYILADDQVLQEDLRNNKALAPWLKEIRSEHMILLNRSADIAQVARELKQMGFMPSVDNENVYTTAEERLRFSLDPDDLARLIALLRFAHAIEEEMGVDLTEGQALPMLNALRPSQAGSIKSEHNSDVMARRWSKNLETALKKKTDSVANKYRKQMKEFLAQKAPTRERPTYTGPDPATETRDIRSLVDFVIEHEGNLQLHYRRSTGEEVSEVIAPESINGDKLYAFSEEEQSYCAYRLKRIVSVRTD